MVASVPVDIEITAPATRAALLSSLARIGQIAAAENLPADTLARVLVVAEELVLNTITHGYGGECGRPVRINLTAAPVLTLVYEDDAPPFDPVLWRRRRAADSPPALREGQAGLDLLFGLASDVRWRPREAGNRLIVTFTPR